MRLCGFDSRMPHCLSSLIADPAEWKSAAPRAAVQAAIRKTRNGQGHPSRNDGSLAESLRAVATTSLDQMLV